MTVDPRWDHLLLDVGLATLLDNGVPYGAVEHGAIGWRDGRIVFAGPVAELAGEPHELARHVESLPGTWVTPGLVDCHTHLVFGGNRAHEFDMCLNGASYEEIARAGGGIVSTVKATRQASEDELFDQALPRAHALLADGVTTLEIKSGYGLDLATERRMLRVARRIGKALGLTVRTSFLGLHALPPEYRDDRDGYVALVCEEVLPMLAAEGMKPIAAVAMPIRLTVTRKVYLRPSLSPRKPNRIAPSGRNPNPTAKPAHTSSICSVSLSAGKKALPINAASVP